MSCDVGKAMEGWRMSCDVGKATEGWRMSCDVGEVTIKVVECRLASRPCQEITNITTLPMFTLL